MALTEAQKKKLPTTLRIILERFHHDPQLFMKLNYLLVQVSQKVAQQAMNHETFCDNFQVPRKISGELLKLYGFSEREIQDAMAKIGFHINNMYKDIYYQTLAIAYLIGLEFDNENIRRMALLLIDIQIWNGRKNRKFPTYCDPDIARYAMQYLVRDHHTLKKSGSLPFEYLDKYSIPAVDEKYSKTIPDNLDSYTEGLRKLIETNHSRFLGLFKSIANAYYKAQREGKKIVISGQYANQYGEGEMVENRETFTGTIDRLTDKILKNSMLKKNVLLSPEAKNVIKQKYIVSDAGIKKINDWLEDEENHDELKYFFELVLASIKPKDESDICSIDVAVLADRVAGAKKDKNLLKAKEILDHILFEILGKSYERLGTQSKYRYKKIVAYGLMIYGKILLCKKL
jgi:hypothetical protein